MEDIDKNRYIADIFRVLSVDTRVHIIRLLATDGPLCVGALAKRLQVSPGAVSQHLRVMRDKGLVQDERRGYYIHYHLARALEEELQQLVINLFAADESNSGSGKCPRSKKSLNATAMIQSSTGLSETSEITASLQNAVSPIISIAICNASTYN